MSPTYLRLAGVLALAACAQPPQGGQPAATASAASVVPAAAVAPAAGGSDLCLGRYALRLPAGARVIARDQSMRDIGLRTRELIAGARLADAPNLAPWITRTDPNTRIGPTVTPVAADTVLLTWRASDRNAAIVDTEAVRIIGNQLIAAHGRGEGTDTVATQRQAALDLVAAATPRPPGALPPRGFCIESFVVAGGFAGEEFAGAAVETGRERRLYATTRSNRAEPPQRLSRGGPGRPPPGVTILRSGERQAGGHTGDELVLSRSAGARRDMLLVWRAVGAPNSGTEPAVELRLEAGEATAPDAVLAEWDTLLASLRRRD